MTLLYTVGAFAAGAIVGSFVQAWIGERLDIKKLEKFLKENQ
jgi:hypothetical protein